MLGRTGHQDILEAEVCVVGAGAAGLALVQALAPTGARVVVLESGGHRANLASDALNEGENVGEAELELRVSRARALGGTTTLWAGQCVPFDDEDFATRSWVPRSGWPVLSEELEPFYRDVERLMDITGASYDEEAWSPFGLTPPTLDPSLLRHRVTVWPRRVDLGRLTSRTLARAPNVRLLLNATVHRVLASSEGAEGVEAHAPDGRRTLVRAPVVVLAAGALENPRLLLASGGLGNHHDVVGRYLQEHPNAQVATVTGADHRRLQDLYALLYRRGRRLLPRLTLAPEAQRAAGVLSCATVVVFEHAPDSGAAAAKSAVRALRARQPVAAVGRHTLRAGTAGPELAYLAWRRLALGRSPATRPQRVRLQMFCEQTPDPTNRVTLADARDRSGLPILRVRWCAGPLEVQTARAMTDALAREFERLGLGRVVPDQWLEEARPEFFRSAYHHMGTTRMSDDPRHGVVDRHGEVHGVPGLCVAGASVFPTSSWANPTFTAMALAVRLAGRLAETGSRPRSMSSLPNTDEAQNSVR